MCKKKTEEEIQNDRVNAVLQRDGRELKSTAKLLLLGTGESGKSTFLKQMKILNVDGYSQAERAGFKKFVYGNIITNTVRMLQGMQQLEIELDPANQGVAKNILSYPLQSNMEENFKRLVGDIKQLIHDPAVQQCTQFYGRFQMGDSSEYFYSHLDRIAKPDYVPSIEDVLRVRIPTSGVTEVGFSVSNRERFTIVDVGGQRSERRKWIYCFTDLTAIIFFVALSEYDQTLYEDETTNRMAEALKLFKDISHYKLFEKTAIILFLNKWDLFEKKIRAVPLSNYFREYTGTSDPDEASSYIQEKFIEMAPPRKKIVVLKTTATDTDNIRKIFRAVKDIVLDAFLKNLGILDDPTSI